MEKIPVKFALMGDETIGYMGVDNVFEPKAEMSEVMRKYNQLMKAMKGCFATVSKPVDMKDGSRVCHLYAATLKTERTIFAF